MGIYQSVCCESIECENECVCESEHSGCPTCGVDCGCICDELYENWKDSQYE